MSLLSFQLFQLFWQIFSFIVVKNVYHVEKTNTTNSHLFNKRGGWNKRGGGAKVAKSLNVEAGINVEGGFFGKN